MENTEMLSRWAEKRSQVPAAILVLMLGATGMGLAGATFLAGGTHLGQAVWVLVRLGLQIIPPLLWLVPTLVIALWLIVLQRMWR